MDAAHLLADLRERGFTLEAANGKLRVRPASKLTEADRQLLAAGKDELLALLTSPKEERPVAPGVRPEPKEPTRMEPKEAPTPVPEPKKLASPAGSRRPVTEVFGVPEHLWRKLPRW